MATESLRKVEEHICMDGVLQLSKLYFVDSQNKKQCLYEEFDGHGRVIKKAMCVDDLFDGLVEEWGKGYYAITSYSKGKREGLFAEYRNNLLVRRGMYHDDALIKEEKYQYKGPQRISEWNAGTIHPIGSVSSVRVHS